jgi:hypothetical protein
MLERLTSGKNNWPLLGSPKMLIHIFGTTINPLLLLEILEMAILENLFSEVVFQIALMNTTL